MLLIGYDLGSSSVKAAIIDSNTGQTIAKGQYPESEMEIQAPKSGWAEQHPEIWWKNVCFLTKKLLTEQNISAEDIQGIGIGYQMHGLVMIDAEQNVLRPSIIWCDSRAVDIGQTAFEALGPEYCLEHYLNSPGNFTASKLRWVIENEPALFAKADKILLPGDYVAMKLTGACCTTVSGLSEGVLWDFKEKGLAKSLMEHFEIPEDLIPEIKPSFAEQGRLTKEAAAACGLSTGTPVTYRAGDQPNNALCLNVLKPGQVAATGGTSGVVYGIIDQPLYDSASRVNGFAHVNYTPQQSNIGVLLCINGTGIQHNWMRQKIGQETFSYPEMEALAKQIPIGSDGVRILPFGNGAERMLENKDLGAQISGLNFNRHQQGHLFRGALEGIAFSFVYGLEIMKEMGLSIDKMRVGNDNLFQSSIFAESIATCMGIEIEVVDTTGAIGAAKAAGMAIGAYDHLEEALADSPVVHQYHPQNSAEAHQEAYSLWKKVLQNGLQAAE